MTDKPSWQDAVSRLAVSHEVDEVKRLIASVIS